jgi:hypothetical protein
MQEDQEEEDGRWLSSAVALMLVALVLTVLAVYLFQRWGEHRHKVTEYLPFFGGGGFGSGRSSAGRRSRPSSTGGGKQQVPPLHPRKLGTFFLLLDHY